MQMRVVLTSGDSTPVSDQQKENHLRSIRRTRFIAYGFIPPTFLFILGFSYYPAIRALVGAFTTWNGFNPPTFGGIANFLQAFYDPVFLGSLWHVGLWTVIGLALALIPPFVVAEFIFQLWSQRAQYIYRTLFVIPLVLPAVVGSSSHTIML